MPHIWENSFGTQSLISILRCVFSEFHILDSVQYRVIVIVNDTNSMNQPNCTQHRYREGEKVQPYFQLSSPAAGMHWPNTQHKRAGYSGLHLHSLTIIDGYWELKLCWPLFLKFLNKKSLHEGILLLCAALKLPEDDKGPACQMGNKGNKNSTTCICEMSSGMSEAFTIHWWMRAFACPCLVMCKIIWKAA